MANKITTVLDLDGQGFRSQIRSLQSSIKEADGATNKLKAGAAGLGGVMKANLAEGAMAAATAFAAFAAKGVQAFQTLALESGKFADATGTSVEEASRLAEVAGDLGIEMGTIQGAFARMNKAAADGTIYIEGFGNAVVRAKDGTVDANQTFINAATAIGAIEDPTLRAKAAQETFGRSYTEIAELMAMDANELREALASVSDQKVITDTELQQARDFRDAWDELKGKFEDAQLQIGGELVPVMTELASAIMGVDAAIAKFAGGEGGSGIAGLIMQGYEQSGLRDLVAGLEAINELAGTNGDEADSAAESNRDHASGINDVADAADRAAPAVAALARDYADLDKAAATYANRLRNDQAEALASLRNRLGEVMRELDGIPAEKVVEINTLLNQGNLAAAEEAINNLARSRVAQIVVSIGAAMGGAMGKLGTGIAGGVAAGAKMGSSIFAKAVVSAVSAASGGGGGGGGGGGATKSPAELEVEAWDAAMEKLLDYGEITRDQYIEYLNMRMAGEDKYSEEYYRYWKIRQGLEEQIAREESDRQRERERAEKEAADEAKRRAEELQRAADEASRASEQLTINVYSNSLDPMAVARAIEQAKKMAGRGFLS